MIDKITNRFIFGVSIVVLVLVVVLLTPAAAFAENEIVSVFSVRGDVKVVQKGANQGVKCEKEMILHAGDWIKTGTDSSVTIAFDKEADNVITIEEKSLIVLRLDGYFKVQLLRGEILAILENVSHDEKFRVLTPSVVTESLNSGWGATSDGAYTNVVVFDNKVFVCGINPEGEIENKKYWIEEGEQRKTLTFEDPGELESLSENAVLWFEKQVMAHHLAKIEEKGSREQDLDMELLGAEIDYGNGETEETASASADKTDLLEYLYKQRLKYKAKRR